MKKVRKLMLISVLALPFIIPTVVKANEQCNPEAVVNDELEGLPIEAVEYDLDNNTDYKSSGFGYSDFFKGARWIRRSGMWSLSITPRDRLLNHPHHMYDAWNVLKAKHSSNRHWSYYSANEEVLKLQFFCHVRYGKYKIPWNIEPARESINPLTCN
ncbi:DUF2599 domain-containing protein [Parvimonas micra]